MPFAADKLAAVARTITQLREALRMYCLAPDKLPVSLDDLSFAVEQVYDLKVNTKIVEVETSFVVGAIKFFDDRIEIYLSDQLSEESARFVFAKELGQLILADADNITDDPVALIKGLVQSQKLPAEPRRKDVISERLAIIVAIELLFPQECRAAARDRVQNGGSLADEAQHFNMPEHAVELAISEGYGEVTRLLWGLPRAAE